MRRWVAAHPGTEIPMGSEIPGYLGTRPRAAEDEGRRRTKRDLFFPLPSSSFDPLRRPPRILNPHILSPPSSVLDPQSSSILLKKRREDEGRRAKIEEEWEWEEGRLVFFNPRVDHRSSVFVVRPGRRPGRVCILGSTLLVLRSSVLGLRRLGEGGGRRAEGTEWEGEGGGMRNEELPCTHMITVDHM